MIDLKSMSLPEMEEYLRQLGEPRFRAGQVAASVILRI